MEQTHFKGLEIVTTHNYNHKTHVIKGRDFDFDGQGVDDNGNDCIGTLLQAQADGWCEVQWSEHDTNNYRIGANGKFDLIYLL